MTRRVLRAASADGVQVAGLAAVVAGIALIYVPAAWIVGGLGLALWAQGRGGGGDDGA